MHILSRTALEVKGNELPGTIVPTPDSQMLTVAEDWPGMASTTATVTIRQRNTTHPAGTDELLDESQDISLTSYSIHLPTTKRFELLLGKTTSGAAIPTRLLATCAEIPEASHVFSRGISRATIFF